MTGDFSELEIALSYFHIIKVFECDDQIAHPQRCLWNHLIQPLENLVLIDKVISLCIDGASAMASKKNGVGGLFRQYNPYLIATHCLNHQLNLCTKDLEGLNGKLQQVFSILFERHSFSKLSQQTYQTLLYGGSII